MQRKMTDKSLNKTSIVNLGHKDCGFYDSHDEFYREKGANLSGTKRWLYSACSTSLD